MEINDIIDYSDNSIKYSLFSNVFFVGFIIYSWLMHNNIVFTINTLKIILIFSVIRYIYSRLTTITKDNGQNYFQINNKVGIFIIIMTILMKEEVFKNIWLPYSLIAIYLYLEIMSAESFTTDILTTSLIGYSLFYNYKLIES